MANDEAREQERDAEDDFNDHVYRPELFNDFTNFANSDEFCCPQCGSRNTIELGGESGQMECLDCGNVC